MNRLTHIFRRPFDEAGSTAVEFALILPLMSVLLFGFFEVGRAFFVYNIASAAARDAARFGARLPMTCGGFVSGGDVARVKSLGATGDPDGAGSPLISGMTASDVGLTYGCVSNTGATPPYAGIYKNVAGVPTLTVTVNAPFQTTFAALFPGFTLNGIVVRHSETWTE